MRLDSDRPDRPACYGRDLAIAVLRQAVADAENDWLPDAAREQARAWLRGGSQWFRFWCSVADLNAEAVAARCLRLYPQRSAHPDRRAS